jgi:hypothetical protein
MNPKSKNQEMHKLYCLCSLLLESLDRLKPTTERMIKYQSDLIGFCEELNNVLADTSPIQRSTYFHNITNKIDSILRNEFNKDM